MKQTHSKIGIASFVISIIACPIFFLTLFIAVIMEGFRPTAMIHDPLIETVLVPSILVLLFANFVALGLGIGGLLKKNRKKIFAILGTILSSVPVVGTILKAIVHNLL